MTARVVAGRPTCVSFVPVLSPFSLHNFTGVFSRLPCPSIMACTSRTRSHGSRTLRVAVAVAVIACTAFWPSITLIVITTTALPSVLSRRSCTVHNLVCRVWLGHECHMGVVWMIVANDKNFLVSSEELLQTAVLFLEHGGQAVIVRYCV